MATSAQEQQYFEACCDAIDTVMNSDGALGTIHEWITPVCTECGTATQLMSDREKARHRIYRGHVVVGCEGYWLIDPKAVPIPSRPLRRGEPASNLNEERRILWGTTGENWSDWTQEQDIKSTVWVDVGTGTWGDASELMLLDLTENEWEQFGEISDDDRQEWALLHGKEFKS
jgi:hypothetical protein